MREVFADRYKLYGRLKKHVPKRKVLANRRKLNGCLKKKGTYVGSICQQTQAERLLKKQKQTKKKKHVPMRGVFADRHKAWEQW